MSDALARRQTVAELVAVYAQAERDIRQSFDLAARAEKAVTDAFALDGGSGRISLESHCHHSFDFAGVELTLKKLRRRLWGILVERLELKRMMSIKAWDELDRQISDGDDVPEITIETVNAMAEQFRAALPSMLEAAVGEVFDWLRPSSSRYKTNSELEIGAKVVLSRMVEIRLGHWRVEFGSDQHLTALENVFSALDGKGQISKEYHSQIYRLIDALPYGAPECVGETEYFAFRGFLNGNLHLRFKRLDLLARLNQIAGGRRLRPMAKTG